jgi:hypothetical protein
MLSVEHDLLPCEDNNCFCFSRPARTGVPTSLSQAMSGIYTYLNSCLYAKTSWYKKGQPECSEPIAALNSVAPVEVKGY